MKQVININFQGRVVPIEQTAYDTLKAYIDSLTRFFAREEGREEIISDIENRIAELFQQRLKDGATCITDDDVSAVIKSMGRPEDFETEDNGAGNTAAGNDTYANAGAAGFTATGHKRLYRDENDKILGGVCSGLANYFGIDTVVVRIIFVLLIISFGFGLIPYIILWVVVPSTATTQIGSVRKKLYRDVESKYIAGVCSGLANYFGISCWIPRVLFLLPFLSFANRWNHWGNYDFPGFIKLGFNSGALIVYIILWLVIPEANTTSEKLEMKGEKVDMNSIKNSVMEEMKGVQVRAAKLGHEARALAADKGRAFAGDINAASRRTGSTLGNIIALFFKIIGYFILGSIGFALVVALFALAIFSIGIFPLKDFVLTSGWQNAFAWGTLVFFIAIPIIGLITWLIRKIARIKTGSFAMRSAFISLWIVGWLSFILLISSVLRDFKRENNLRPQEVTLTNAGLQKMEVTSRGNGNNFKRETFLRFEPFDGLDEDTAMVRNVRVNIYRSSTDSFRVTMMKVARGYTKAFADTAAALIQYNVVQRDSLLVLDKGISINSTDKFRNQQVIVNIYVPVGKQIRIDNSISRWGGMRIDGFGVRDNDWNFDTDGAMNGWETDVDYVMKADGLYTMYGEKADGNNDRSRRRVKTSVTTDGVTVEKYEDEDAGYRYNDNTTPAIVRPEAPVSLDTMKQRLKLDDKRIKDSIERAIEKSKQELDKLQKKTQGTTAMNTPVLQGYNPVLLMN